MQYLCYIAKDNPGNLMKLEYQGKQDIKFIAALTFIIGKWWMDTSLSLVIDAIEWNIQYDKILDIFNTHCTIVKDDLHEVLNKKVVTVADLFS